MSADGSGRAVVVRAFVVTVSAEDMHDMSVVWPGDGNP